MIRFLFRFFSFPFPFYLLYDKSRPKKENHQTLIRINREISFPSSFLSKLFLSQNIGFSSGFSCQAKIMFVRAILRMLWFIRLCHDSDSFAICTETVFKLFRFFLSALPIVFKADQLFSSAIPVSLKFSSLLLRFFRKFFTLSISFHVERRDFFRSGIFLFDEPLGSSLSGISVSCLSLLSFQNLHLLVLKIPFARFFFIQLWWMIGGSEGTFHPKEMYSLSSYYFNWRPDLPPYAAVLR